MLGNNMDKQTAHETLDSKACGMEEICLGLGHGHSELNEDDFEYIEDACEQILEAVKYLKSKSS